MTRISKIACVYESYDSFKSLDGKLKHKLVYYYQR